MRAPVPSPEARQSPPSRTSGTVPLLTSAVGLIFSQGMRVPTAFQVMSSSLLVHHNAIIDGPARAALGRTLPPVMSAPDHPEVGPLMLDEDREAALEVIIVGAGDAGIGCAESLTNGFGLDRSCMLLLERGEAIGTSLNGSFRPNEMRFLSPSFYEGWTISFDLNSVTRGSPPACSWRAQQPSGEHVDHLAESVYDRQYWTVQDELAEPARLRDRVKLRTEVIEVATPGDGIFCVVVRTRGCDGVARKKTLRTRHVVWAAGEFQLLRRANQEACYKTAKHHVAVEQRTDNDSGTASRVQTAPSAIGGPGTCACACAARAAHEGRK